MFVKAVMLIQGELKVTECLSLQLTLQLFYNLNFNDPFKIKYDSQNKR